MSVIRTVNISNDFELLLLYQFFLSYKFSLTLIDLLFKKEIVLVSSENILKLIVCFCQKQENQLLPGVNLGTITHKDIFIGQIQITETSVKF